MLAAIETSFDDAGAALCDGQGRIVCGLLSSQAELHAPYRGVVPELAARSHLQDLPRLWRSLPAVAVAQLTAVGVTCGPGLPGSLLAGLNFARGLASALEVPLYGLNHLQGHIFSPFMDSPAQAIPYPHLALLVSGGHTELFLVRGLTQIELLGQTQDDAVGELLDKISALLGYGYPGGARLEVLARSCPRLDQAGRYSGDLRLPVPMRSSGDLNFSYSGLKTAVVRQVRAAEAAGRELTESDKAELVAALFASVLDSLWLKVEAALRSHPVTLLTVSGGVAINGLLRERFAQSAAHAGLELLFPQPRHCLDNAEMMAWLLWLQLAAGEAVLAHDIRSNWLPGSELLG